MASPARVSQQDIDAFYAAGYASVDETQVIQDISNLELALDTKYRVTHHIVQSIPLTSKQKFRFGLAKVLF